MEQFSSSMMLSIAAGIALSAACGFRVFVPFAMMSLASITGQLELAEGFQWVGTYPALITLLTATVLEVGAYYIPWLDNALDMVATPAAVVAGSIVSASFFTDMSPYMTWLLVAIAGGTAGIIQTSSVLARGLSTATTGGVGNAVVASTELAGSVALSIAAIMIPVVAFGVVMLLCFSVLRRLVRRLVRCLTKGRYVQPAHN